MDKKGFAFTTTTILIISIVAVSIATLGVITYYYIQSEKTDSGTDGSGGGSGGGGSGGGNNNNNLGNNATHLVCINNACTRIVGIGLDTCSPQGAYCGGSGGGGGGSGGGGSGGGGSGVSGYLTIISPSEGQSFGYNKSILLNYTITNNTASSCWYYIDNLASQDLPNCNISWFNVSVGSHAIYVRANVSGGTLSDSNSFTVSLDAPTVSLVSPSNNSGTNNRSVTFSYNVYENPSDDLSYCELWGDFTGTYAKNQTNTTVSSGNDRQFKLNNLPDRKYNWAVSCVDKENNRATTGNWSFVVDTIAPKVNIVLPKGTYNTNFGIPLNFSIMDAGGVINGCSYYTTNQSYAFAGSNFQCMNITIPTAGYLSNGPWIMNVTVVDIAGNQGMNFSNFIVNVSNNSSGNPSISLTANPISGTAPLQVTFNYSAYDPLGITKYKLDCGDSVCFDVTISPNNSVSGVNNHIYQNGTFVANFSVVGGSGARSVTQTIYVGGGGGGGPGVKFVCNATDLDEIRNGLAGSYLQTCNIDLAGYNLMPIGSPGSDFVGVYDGNGYSINGFSFNNKNASNVGLFGSIAGAVIQNVTLNGVNIIGGASTASLVGRISSGSNNITNSGANGNVYGYSGFVGGLVGNIASTSVTNIINSAAVVNVYGNETAFSFTGGLVGFARNTIILHSGAWGNVIGYGSVGGLVGDISVSNGEQSLIVDSWAIGDVNGTKGSGTGGLVGVIISGIVNNSIATGSVHGSSYVGGLVGNCAGGCNITTAWAGGAVYGNTKVGGLVGSSVGGRLVNVNAGGNVNGVDGDYVGGLCGGTCDFITNSGSNGSVSTYNSSYVGGLVGSGGVILNSWSDGNVIVVSDKAPLSLGSKSSVGGLAGSANNITNSWTVSDINAYNISYVGGLVGSGGNINASYAGGNVVGGAVVGGLVGSATAGSKIYSSWTNSNTTGKAFVGGLVGILDGSYVNKSFAKGYSTANTQVGGLVGAAGNSAIFDSFSTGKVSALGGTPVFIALPSIVTVCTTNGNSYTGGLVGCLASSNVVNSYTISNTSSVLSTGTGGLVGSATSSSVVSSYWDLNRSEQTTSAGGTGKTTTEMRTQSTYVGWDFANVWDGDAMLGTTYPALRWATLNCGPLGCSPEFIAKTNKIWAFVIFINAIILGVLVAFFIYFRRKETRERSMEDYARNSRVLNKVGREHLRR